MGVSGDGELQHKNTEYVLEPNFVWFTLDIKVTNECLGPT